jgi:hypothetical protein
MRLAGQVSFGASKTICCSNLAVSGIEVATCDIAGELWWRWLADMAATRAFSPPYSVSNGSDRVLSFKAKKKTQHTGTAQKCVALRQTCNRNLICLAFCIGAIPWFSSPHTIV